MTEKIKSNHVRRFKTLAKKLNDLMVEIQEYNPEANYYAEDSFNFCLMKGPTHDDDMHQQSMQQNIVCDEFVLGLSGGGW